MVPRPAPDLFEGPLTRLGPPQGSPNPSRAYPRVPQPVPDLLEGPLPYSDLPEVPPSVPDPSRTSPRVKYLT